MKELLITQIQHKTNSTYKQTVLSDLFQGCKNKRGVLGKIINGQKKAWQEPQPFDWNRHLSGELVQGLSPVDCETGKVKFICLDIDLTIKPEEFPGNIWTYIGYQYRCYRTMGGKWRVVEHLDDWIGVEEGKQRAKLIEKRIEELLGGYKCDSGHTLPQGYSLEEDKPGNWIFMPYHNEDTVCYGPGGNKYSVKQLEYSIRYKNHPVVVSCIGMKGKGEKNSRRKALFAVALYKRHFPECDVTLEEVNQYFHTPLDPAQLQKDIAHVERSKLKYDKKFLLNGLPGWIQKFCGARALIDAQGLFEVNKVLTSEYIYVRARGDFFELKSLEFVDKERMNDWWKHITKKDSISPILLKDEKLKKLHSYLTHAGLPSGIVELKRGQVKGLEPGEYLNIYQESGVTGKPGDISKFNEYYSWALGKENWLIVKQCLAFMLKEPGEKIQWFIIWHSKTQGVGKGLFALVMQSLFGTRNVKINVKFKEITTGHSTIIEGAQIIVLNELSLTNSKGDLKELSNDFKSFITEPNLIINPKHKPQVEIPNLCNFFVFSNSDTPLFLGESDRRAFVVNINTTKEKVKDKLLKEGYKKEILKVMEDPSAFKWHLENEIEYDREMFFEDAPMTKDKEELIQENRSDFEKVMDQCYEALTFPFGNQKPLNDKEDMYFYKGIMNSLDLFKHLKASQLFKGVFFKIDDVTKYLKSKCTPWNKKGDNTIQIISSFGKIRVYLIHNGKVKGKPIIEMGDKELGQLWDRTPEEGDINNFVTEMPNYEEPKFDEDEDYHSESCWNNCKAFDPVTKKYEQVEINSSTCQKCSLCDYAYICTECGMCACQKPNSKIKQKNR